MVTATDAALVYKKFLDNGFTLPIEDRVSNYLIYADVNSNKRVDENDADQIFKKVLNGDYEYTK